MNVRLPDPAIENTMSFVIIHWESGAAKLERSRNMASHGSTWMLLYTCLQSACMEAQVIPGVHLAIIFIDGPDRTRTPLTRDGPPCHRNGGLMGPPKDPAVPMPCGHDFRGRWGPARIRMWDQGIFLVAALQPLTGQDADSSTWKCVFRANRAGLTMQGVLRSSALPGRLNHHRCNIESDSEDGNARAEQEGNSGEQTRCRATLVAKLGPKFTARRQPATAC
jgi:hypothetical protein